MPCAPKCPAFAPARAPRAWARCARRFWCAHPDRSNCVRVSIADATLAPRPLWSRIGSLGFRWTLLNALRRGWAPRVRMSRCPPCQLTPPACCQVGAFVPTETLTYCACEDTCWSPDCEFLSSDMRLGRYHVYACGETIDYSNSCDAWSFSTPFLVDSIRVIIREESSQQRDSILDIIRLLLPASAFGFLCYTSVVAVRCACTQTRLRSGPCSLWTTSLLDPIL